MKAAPTPSKPRFKLHLDGSVALVANAQTSAHLATSRPARPVIYVPEGLRLKQARTALGFTQLELAEKINSSLAAVKAYERGASFPRREFARQLANAGISMVFVEYGLGEPLLDHALVNLHEQVLL